MFLIFSMNTFAKDVNRKNRDADVTKHIEVPIKDIVGNQAILWISNLIGFPYKKPLVFVTYGQSNSVNQSERGYEVSEDVYMFIDGKTYRYRDPALGGTGGQGSVWGRVGDQLIQNNFASSVVFVNTGWSGASIHDLTYSHQYSFFEEQLLSTVMEVPIPSWNVNPMIVGAILSLRIMRQLPLLGSVGFETPLIMVSLICSLSNQPDSRSSYIAWLAITISFSRIRFS